MTPLVTMMMVMMALGLTVLPTRTWAQNSTSDSDSDGSSSSNSDSSSSSSSSSSSLLDQFTYKDEGSDSPNHIYPPDEWIKVQCSNLDECVRSSLSCWCSSLLAPGATLALSHSLALALSHAVGMARFVQGRDWLGIDKQRLSMVSD